MAKKTPVILTMSFRLSGGSIEGNGTDDLMGFFTIKGHFNEKAPYPCDFTWQFAGVYDIRMEFNGWRESDKGGFFGQWKGPNGSGSFAFAPSKESSEAAKKLQEEAHKAHKTQLLSMGFPEWLVDQALQETKGLEPALNWCTEQMNGGKDTSLGVGNDQSVDQEALIQLVSMGFDEETAKEALIKHGGKLEEAANYLFDQ